MATEEKTFPINLTIDDIELLLKLVWDFKKDLIQDENWSYVDEIEELYDKLDIDG